KLPPCALRLSVRDSASEFLDSLTCERVIRVDLQRSPELALGERIRSLRQVDGAEVGVRVGVIGIGRDQPLEDIGSLRELALTHERHAEIVQGVAVRRIAVERALELGDGVGQPAEAIQHYAE